MTDWVIADHEIESVEKLLLPEGAHFADDARTVIRCWDSTEVSACPGSGKTTVLLAKLKLLADRMPLGNGAGICVLSHTNVAVNEIKSRLSGYAERLLSYPNYIGTIQSFFDRFVTMPYLRGNSKVSLQFVSREVYGRYLYNWIWHDQSRQSPFNSLRYFIRNKYQNGKYPYANEEEYFMNVRIGGDGIYHRTNKLAGFDSNSGKQYLQAKRDLLANEGILLYDETYSYAKDAIETLSEEYTDFFSKRFRYVFIDEYQDCDELQRIALKKLFDSGKCNVMRMGDPDQAIFNGQDEFTTDWTPTLDCLSIASSCRYSQEIADVLIPLRKYRERIVSSAGRSGYLPVVFVFDKNNPSCVVQEYAKLIISRGLNKPGEKHYSIGFRREASSCLTVGSYWNQFDAVNITKEDSHYWPIIDEICTELIKGRLYLAEKYTRRLVYRIYRELGVKNPDTEKLFSRTAINDLLRNKRRDMFFEQIQRMSSLEQVNRDSVDEIIKKLIVELLDDEKAFEKLPYRFLENNSRLANREDRNVCSEYGVNIIFDTIHSVKGQTHSTTLYLETECKNGSDLARILHLYGAGSGVKSPVYDYSRKLAYVGMSRPKKLLCVAMQSKTFDKGKEVFDNGSWEVIDLRNGTYD